eukprot:7466422-Pyramimonas_sp.AAC.1
MSPSGAECGSNAQPMDVAAWCARTCEDSHTVCRFHAPDKLAHDLALRDFAAMPRLVHGLRLRQSSPAWAAPAEFWRK